MCISKPNDMCGIVLRTVQRDFQFKFSSENQASEWFRDLMAVTLKEVKIPKYLKRKELQESMREENETLREYKSLHKEFDEAVAKLDLIREKRSSLER